MFDRAQYRDVIDAAVPIRGQLPNGLHLQFLCGRFVLRLRQCDEIARSSLSSAAAAGTGGECECEGTGGTIVGEFSSSNVMSAVSQ